MLPIGTGWVKFTVVLETDAASEKPWEVALWCDLELPNGEKWTELAFEEETNPTSFVWPINAGVFHSKLIVFLDVHKHHIQR